MQESDGCILVPCDVASLSPSASPFLTLLTGACVLDPSRPVLGKRWVLCSPFVSFFCHVHRPNLQCLTWVVDGFHPSAVTSDVQLRREKGYHGFLTRHFVLGADPTTMNRMNDDEPFKSGDIRVHLFPLRSSLRRLAVCSIYRPTSPGAFRSKPSPITPADARTRASHKASIRGAEAFGPSLNFSA